MKEDSKKLTLQNLKEYLDSIPHENSVEFLCLDDCSECDVLVDGQKYRKIEDFLDKSIEVYRYDFSYGMIEVERYDDVCFSYSVDKQGVGEQVFVKFNERVYDFSTYITSPPIYDSLQDAAMAKESLVQEVLR